MDQILGSRDVATAALKMAVTRDRQEEKDLQTELSKIGIHTAGVDFGGEFSTSIGKLIERTVVAAKRENLIHDIHNEIGAVAGAAREAASQIATKALGFNVGGKIGIARYQDHICVAIFFSISLLHLNETGVGLGHRVI